MSEDNLQTLGKLREAFDRKGWDGVFPFLHADFEFHEPPEQPGATVFHGHEEARTGWARWAEAWIEQRSEPQEVIELSDGRILVFTLQTMRGRDGLEVESESANVFTFRDGKVLRWESYWKRENALEAVEPRD